jgi:hypothetical protein
MFEKSIYPELARDSAPSICIIFENVSIQKGTIVRWPKISGFF